MPKDHHRLKTYRKFGTRRGFAQLIEKMATVKIASSLETLTNAPAIPIHSLELQYEQTVGTATTPNWNGEVYSAEALRDLLVQLKAYATRCLVCRNALSPNAIGMIAMLDGGVASYICRSCTLAYDRTEIDPIAHDFSS